MKKLLKLSVMVAFVFYGKQSYSQNPAWILAPNYFVDFYPESLPQGPYPSSDYSGQSATTSQNAMADQNGKLLFFIVDGNIYDGEGYIIRELPSVGGYDIKGGSETAIVPDPGNCERYYIFTVGRSSYSSNNARKKPFYCILDLSLPNITHTGRFGALATDLGPEVVDLSEMVTDYNQNDLASGGVFFAVSEKRPDNSRFVFVSGNFGIYRFKLNGNLVYDNYFMAFPSAVRKLDLRGEMELVKLPAGGYRIAAPFFFEYFDGYSIISRYAVYTVQLHDNGTIIYPETYIPFDIPPSGPHPWVQGLEFSPDGSILYITHNISSNHPNPIEFYDFNNISAGVQQLSVTSASDFESSQIETGTDGALYFATGNRLAKLNTPNNPYAASSNWVNNAASISYSPNYEGTPYTDHHLKSYVLPDQTDGGSYTAHMEEITACCLFYASFDVGSFTAPASATWQPGSNPLVSTNDTEVTIEKELRIPAGTSVVIQDMTLKFAPGARLVIENGTGSGQGGKLRLMNTVLTNLEICGAEDMWLGVEVWGNSTAAQGNIASSTQGVFRMYGNSRIEHAVIGVLASKRNETNGEPLPLSYNTARDGGIVIVENSGFFNCYMGALFQSYNVGSTNVSYFQNVDFVWDGLLKDLTKTPYLHLGLVQCTDVRVTASGFYQNTPDIYTNKNQRGIGILAFNSSFFVHSSCNAALPLGQDCPEANVIPSKFENLHAGIGVLNGNEKPFTVLRNEFTNCVFGVTSTMAKNQTISRNKFFIHEDNMLQTWGIHVTNGDKYKIEENSLTSVSGTPAQTYGIIIDNSGEAHNEVYKNTFKDLYIGTQSQRVNGDQYEPGANDNAGGLRYNCNQFSSVIQVADIAVAVNSRIDYEQGRAGGLTENEARNVNTARNRFSYTSAGHDILLSAGSQQVNYHHLNDAGHAPLTYTGNPPAAVYPYAQTWGATPLYANAGTCLTNYPSVTKKYDFPFGKSYIIDSLHNKTDGGKTSYLLGLIASSPNSTGTYSELVDASPYLSDQVLQSYIGSGASNDNLKDILVANSRLSDHVWNVLQNSDRPGQLKTDMELYQGIPSAQQALYHRIRTEESDLSYAQKEFLSGIINDTNVVAKSDSLIKYLELCRGIDFKKMLLSEYSKIQDKTRFDSLKSVLSYKLPSDLIDLYELQYRLNGYASWKDAAAQDGSIISGLGQITLTGTDHTAIRMAELTLAVLSDSLVEPDILPLTFSPKNALFENGSNPEGSHFLQAVKLFPNPSEGTVHFNFSGLESKSVIVQLVDLTGKEVFRTQFSSTASEKIDLSHLRKGTYLVRVVIDDLQADAQLLILE